MKDPIGKAIHDYYFKKAAENITINSNLTEDEEIPPSYFFRTLDEMPLVEKTALRLCKGKILDIGAGAGAHSIILQNENFVVTAIEQSSLSCKVLKSRGISCVENTNIFDFDKAGFDTTLLLMNGIGIAGDIIGLERLLKKLKGILKPNGQVLLDSSDIKYLFDEEDGSYWVNIANDAYYGEMTYEAKYENIISKPFKWLFVDFEKLSVIASKCGFKCEKAVDGNHYDYLAKLTISII